MLFMNEWEIEEVLDFTRSRATEIPNLFAAAEHLYDLMEWTNHNSDGWPYWSKPCQAAKKLQESLSRVRRNYIDGTLTDMTDAEFKAALRPIKAFYTRQGVAHSEVLR